MASILQVGKAWRARVRRRGHRDRARDFPTKARAEEWARAIESQMDKGRPIEDASVSVADLIAAYRRARDGARPIAPDSNEHYMLKNLAAELGDIRAARMSAEDLVGWARARRDQGAGAYTVNMEVSKLGTVLRFAAPLLRIELPDVVGQARPLLRHYGLIGGGNKRARRASEDELTRICARLAPRYAIAIRFMVYTAMRRGEVCRIVWADLDETKRCVWVRNRKDPRNKQGNDQLVPLLGEAWKILLARRAEAKVQAVVEGRAVAPSERIFPIHPQTLSKYFREACLAEAIPDLRPHDLRHEGTSRLFEEGYAIQQVALVTGHKDWRHLRRYTNLRPEDLHRD